LAREVVALYHGEDAGAAAEARFDLVHKQGGIPDDVPEAALPPDMAGEERVWLPRLLVAVGLATSNAEGRRLIEQGAVEVDGARVTDPATELAADGLAGRVLRVGRHRFVRIQPPNHG